MRRALIHLATFLVIVLGMGLLVLASHIGEQRRCNTLERTDDRLYARYCE